MTPIFKITYTQVSIVFFTVVLRYWKYVERMQREAIGTVDADVTANVCGCIVALQSARADLDMLVSE
jgi:hypothetical protein